MRGTSLGNNNTKTAGELVGKFAGILESSQVFKKFEKIEESFKGTLKICREKIGVLNEEEASTVLVLIEGEYKSKLMRNVEGIFLEELEEVKVILEEVDIILSELQTLLDTIKQKLQDVEEVDLFQSYEDCRSILTFLRLKTNIFKSNLSSSLYEKTKSELFNQSFLDAEDNFFYLAAKLNTVTTY